MNRFNDGNLYLINHIIARTFGTTDFIHSNQLQN